MPATRPLVERFWEYVTVSEGDACWGWRGATTRGYGVLRVTGERRNVRASRLSWEIHNGPIPAGMLVCHTCDNPPCCNYAHLFLGTYADNNADRGAKGRSNRGNRPSDKLDEGKVREIRRRAAAGEQLIHIAPDFGVHSTVISRVVRRLAWAGVN